MLHWLVKYSGGTVVVTADNFNVSTDGLVFVKNGIKVAWFLKWELFFNMATAHLSEEQWGQQT